MIMRSPSKPTVPFAINERSPQAKGLMGWWTFSESSGLYVLDHVASNHCTVGGGPMAPYHNAEVGAGLKFVSTSSQYTYLPSANTAAVSVAGKTTASLSAWFIPLVVPAAGKYAPLYNESTSNQYYSRFALYYYPNGTIVAVAATATTTLISVAGPVLTIGNLYKFDMTYNSDTDQMILYVNGLEYARNSAAKGPIYATLTWAEVTVMGYYQANYINGVLFDTRLRNFDMSPDLIWHEYDPRTRLDLYKQQIKVYIIAASGAVYIHDCVHAHVSSTCDVHKNTLDINDASHSHVSTVPVLGRYISSISNCNHSHSSPNITTMTSSSNVNWDPDNTNQYITLLENNLRADIQWIEPYHGKATRTDISHSFGKWYAEFELLAGSTLTGIQAPCIGVGNASAALDDHCGENANSWGYSLNEQYLHDNVWTTAEPYEPVLENRLGVAWDADAGKLWFSYEGYWLDSGDPESGANPAFTGVTGELFLMCSMARASGFRANFGHTAFTYTCPAGFDSWEPTGTLIIKSAGHALSDSDVTFFDIASCSHALRSTALWTVELENTSHGHSASSVDGIISSYRAIWPGLERLELEYLMESVDEYYHTIADTSGQGKYGLITGAVAQCAGFIGGGNALEFDGSDLIVQDWVDFSDYAVTTYGDWTVSAHIKLSTDYPDQIGNMALTGAHYAPAGLIFYDPYVNGFHISVQADGVQPFVRVVWIWQEVMLGTLTPLDYECTEVFPGEPTDIFSVAIRRTNSTGYGTDGLLEFFCNGMKIGESVVTNELIHGDTYPHRENVSFFSGLGAREYYSFATGGIKINTSGMVDNFRIHDRLLTDAEILFLAREPFGFFPGNATHGHTASEPNVYVNTVDIDDCTHGHTASTLSIQSSFDVPDYYGTGEYDSPKCQENIGPPADYVSAGEYNTLLTLTQNHVLDVPDYASAGQYWFGVYTLDIPDYASGGKYDIPELEQQHLNVQFAGSLLCPADILAADWNCVGTLVEDTDLITAELSVPTRFTADLTEDPGLISADFNVVGALTQTTDLIAATLTVSYVFDCAASQATDLVTATIQPTPMFTVDCRAPADLVTATLNTPSLFVLSGIDAPDTIAATLFAGAAFTGELVSAADLLDAVLCVDAQFVATLLVEIDDLAALLVPQERFVSRIIRWPTTRPRFAGTLVEDANVLTADWDGGDI